jgi:hypothetical protein
MTQLTDAPELVLLQDLSKGWRKVCHMEGERHVWYGDLRTLALRRVYQDMILRDEAIAVQYKLRDGVYAVFAKQSAGMPRYRISLKKRWAATARHD